MNAALERAVLHAHAAGDSNALADIYARAAETTQDPDEKGFLLTQAYVFALVSGGPFAEDLRLQLVAMGREPAS